MISPKYQTIAKSINSYLDRQALPNARIQGLEVDLKLKGEEFNTAISVLFAGYIALQIPSNMLLTRVRPSIYLVSIPYLPTMTSNPSDLVKAGLHGALGCCFCVHSSSKRL
jgi:hypothetical protein